MVARPARTVAAVLIAACLGLAGCDGSGALSTAPTAPPAAAATGSASASPPPAVEAPSPMPDAAERSVAGARSFVEYWFAALDYASGTGDVELLAAASAPRCRLCSQLISDISDVYRLEFTVQGGVHRIRDITTVEFSLDARPVLTVFYDRSSRVVLCPAGQVGRTTPAATFIQSSATLRHTGRGWVVIDLTDMEPIT